MAELEESIELFLEEAQRTANEASPTDLPTLELLSDLTMEVGGILHEAIERLHNTVYH